MNIRSIELKSITRLIAHEIHPKTSKKDAYAVTKDDLLTIKKQHKDILITRLTAALANSTKTFQLDYDEKSDNNIYPLLQCLDKITDEKFIDCSKTLAENLAIAHFRTKIPGGYCLVGQGMTTKGKIFFFVIKAELQEVFSIDVNILKIIEDVFLSPAKDFYKIGFFVQNGSSYLPFMFDDQFTLQKKDLTEYFYAKFLGLTTDKNDSLRTKNFYQDAKHFIEKNVDNFQDRLGLLNSLKVLYREDTSGIISPRDFSDKYLEGKLKIEFEKRIIEDRYPQSFTRDISLIQNRLELQRVSIPLTYELSLVGNANTLSNVEIIDDPTEDSIRNLEPQINNRSINKIIILKQA